MARDEELALVFEPRRSSRTPRLCVCRRCIRGSIDFLRQKLTCVASATDQALSDSLRRQ
jgi:hypothetical protein